MRVTKSIKEFIEEQVDTIFGDYQPLPERVQFNEELELINEEVKAFARAKGIELAKSHDVPEIEVRLGCTLVNVYNPYVSKDNALKRVHNAQIEKEIKDIIVTLELGGTKDELMETLAKLKEKVGR